MGGAVITFESGNPGAGAANAKYITRSQAADRGSLTFHNQPEGTETPHDHTTRAGWQDQRMRLETWAQMRQEEEISRHGNRAGDPRTHYRTVLSFEEKISSERAVDAAQEWLEEEFPDARAFAVAHQDTEHTHVHVWMSARKTDGSKINVSASDFRSLTSEWDRIYAETMDREAKLKEKMEETREFKREYAKMKEEGASPYELGRWTVRNRPERATPPSPEVYRQRDERRAGKDVADQAEEMVETIKESRHEQIETLADKIESQIDQRGAHEREQAGSRTAEPEARSHSTGAREGERKAEPASQSQDEGGDQPDSGRADRSGQAGSKSQDSGRGGRSR
jgi:hypothetical protein